MDDRKKDEAIIELTDVVEEPSAAGGRWMETAPPAAPEKKGAENLGARKEPPLPSSADLKGIPDSPLKKFILAEEEFSPPSPPGGEKPGHTPRTPRGGSRRHPGSRSG